MFHAAQDEIVPYYDAVNAAKTWCTAGANINFVTEIGAVFGVTVGHLLAAEVANGNAQYWLSLLMNGGTAATGCHWNTDATGTYTANSGTPTPLQTPGTGT